MHTFGCDNPSAAPTTQAAYSKAVLFPVAHTAHKQICTARFQMLLHHATAVMMTTRRVFGSSPRGRHMEYFGAALGGMCCDGAKMVQCVCPAGGYTSCDGVPDPDMAPLVAKSGRRLHGVKQFVRRVLATCNKDTCCKKGLAAGKKYGCIPCAKGWCKPGNVFAHVVSKKNKRCQCHMWGSCPMWFNKNCRFRKPSGRTKN
jgi:hypothetical protein